MTEESGRASAIEVVSMELFGLAHTLQIIRHARCRAMMEPYSRSAENSLAYFLGFRKSAAVRPPSIFFNPIASSLFSMKASAACPRQTRFPGSKNNDRNLRIVASALLAQVQKSSSGHTETPSRWTCADSFTCRTGVTRTGRISACRQAS